MMIRGPNKVRASFTLIELVLTVMLLAILAGIAIPRFGWGTIDKVDARTCARQFANYLKLARSLAITNAADNTSGYKVVVSGPFTSYSIINAGTEDVVKGPIEIPEGWLSIGGISLRLCADLRWTGNSGRPTLHGDQRWQGLVFLRRQVSRGSLS